jgi:hypothetical protein
VPAFKVVISNDEKRKCDEDKVHRGNGTRVTKENKINGCSMA